MQYSDNFDQPQGDHPQSLRKAEDMVVSKTRLTIWVGTLVLVVLLAIGAVGYSFYYVASIKGELEDLREARIQTKSQLVEEIGKLIILPEGEDPTIATVVDPELLRDQPFFKNAKAGDRVLIYSKDSRAVLYDPVASRVVEIGYLNTNPESSSGDQLPPGVGQ